MMRRCFRAAFLGILLIPFGICMGLPEFRTKDPIRNQDPNKALNVSQIDEKNPIRDGMYGMIENPSLENPSTIDGVIVPVRIDSHGSALDETMRLIQIIINYTLAILAFLTLVYLVYHGFLMLTASGDDKKFEKGKA